MDKFRLHTFGATLLVAGTSIGAGMLALPVITSKTGFFPSLFILAISWIFMMITGFLFAELSIWLRQDVNMLTMAEKTLGRLGKGFAFCIYLFLFYSILVAYMAGGGNLFGDLFCTCSDKTKIILFTFVFIGLMAIGPRFIDSFNKVLVGGLFCSYFGFVCIGSHLVQTQLLQYHDFKYAFTALPIAFTSFGYQGVIPTLCDWMQYDRKKIFRAIAFGTTITFVTYVIWQWLILGSIPFEGEHGLIDSLAKGRDAVYPLKFFTQNETVLLLGRAFAFFAIATSFVGVGLGLIDFWADAFHIHRKRAKDTLLLFFLAFGLPLLIATSYPTIFLRALSVAGGFGSALLLGLLPILMVYRAKYTLHAQLFHRSFLGSKAVLFILLAFVIGDIICEVINIAI
jgi:tyrosine-specific transport protein